MISLKDMQKNLKEYGLSIFKMPLVLQYNKRDLADEAFPMLTVEQLEHDLNRQLKVPAFPASALKGDGVGVTLKECLKLTLKSLKKQFQESE